MHELTRLQNIHTQHAIISHMLRMSIIEDVIVRVTDIPETRHAH